MDLIKQQIDMSETTQFDPYKIEKPDPILFRYYVFCALLSGPLTPIVLAPMYFRYITLRYQFDDEGVSMRWGILFKREVYLTYRRIQDIHLTKNILQRWMGLAKISLQTASGNSQAEMAIEGILEAEELRDFLYSKMRGAKSGSESGSELGSEATEDSAGASANSVRATEALEGIEAALTKLVERQEQAGSGS
ncbi:MAG: PH domain-containing protein [Planctomycetota bacterium]